MNINSSYGNSTGVLWQAPERALNIAAGASAEIIEPLLIEIISIESTFSKLMADVESERKLLFSEKDKIANEMSGIILNASRHLETQKISIQIKQPETVKVTKEIAGNVDPDVCLKSAAKLKESALWILQNAIQNQKRPEYAVWPVEGSAGCFFACAILAMAWMGFAIGGGWGLVILGGLTYFGITLLCNKKPVDNLVSAYNDIADHTVKVDSLFDALLKTMEDRFGSRIISAEELRANSISSLKSRLGPKIHRLREEVGILVENCQYGALDWQNEKWQHWQPSLNPEFVSSFGMLCSLTSECSNALPELDLPLTIPAFMPFANEKGLIIQASGVYREIAIDGINSLLSRLLATIPPGKSRMTFIDPIGLGNSVAAFMPLADYEESLINSRAWSEPQHIEARLAEITEHMETVIQKYLRTDYKTIHDYNAAAGEIAEPYRFVVVFDFPVNFNDVSARRLVSIARNGARCGVFVVLASNPEKAAPYGFTMDELHNTCNLIYADTEKVSQRRILKWRNPHLDKWEVRIDSPMPDNLLSEIIRQVGEASKSAMRVEVPYEKLLALANLGEGNWWKAKTNKSILVPLGPTGARKLQFLTLGEGMGHHVLIVGRPGSGKSNLMHVIITTLALTYSPDEMRVYLIDFKKGVEFKSYADHKLPHAEAIAVESEREFGLSVVERLDLELTKRGNLFRAVGAANITDYREKTTAEIPRILLLVDEFQEFFTQDDHVARQTTLVLDRLVRQGRAFGIHIILGSQTLAGSYNLSRSTLDQMAVRIAMQCSEADSRLILSDDNPAARLLSRPGEAIYNSASGLVEGNNLFQVARFSDEDREERLKLVTKIALDSGKPIPVPIVFEGNELAHLTDCRKLGVLLGHTDWPAKKGVELLLGDPIAIRDPIAARMRRQSGSHLLILSRDEAEGVGMCVASILCILAQQRPAFARIIIADFTLADSEWAERAEEIEEFFPHDVKVLSRQRDVAEEIKTIADEIKRRIDAPPEESSTYLVLQGMQRIKILRTDDETFSYDNESATPSELFATVLREGPEVGVHVIAWCDTYSNAIRVANRRTMTEFGSRAGGVMSADDSQSFFDDAAASRIDKPHRVMFLDEERPGQLEKFRPYSMPPREWLEKTGYRLRDRYNPQPN